jgi:hypothetical protein
MENNDSQEAKSACFRLVHPQKALCPIVVTLEARLIRSGFSKTFIKTTKTQTQYPLQKANQFQKRMQNPLLFGVVYDPS